MKTTLDLPDALFRKAKSKAAERGQSLKAWVAEAIQEKLVARTSRAEMDEPEWMAGFGKLRRLQPESERIRARIDEAFETIEPEDRS